MRFLYLIISIVLVCVSNGFAGSVDVLLKSESSGRVVAQIKAESDGSFSFASIPDGKYKLEFVVATKRFALDTDIDADGTPDLELNSTLAKTTKSIRLTMNEQRVKKPIPMGEWMQKLRAAWQSQGFEIATEIVIQGNSIKGKVRCSDGTCL